MDTQSSIWLQGNSALMSACREGHADVCGLLLSAGADIDFTDDKVGHLPSLGRDFLSMLLCVLSPSLLYLCHLSSGVSVSSAP